MELKGSLDRYRNQAINMVVLLVCAFFAMNLYKQQMQKVSSLEAIRAEEEKRNARLNEFGELKKQMDALSDFINKKDITQTLGTFSALAKESNVKIIALRPAGPQESPPFIKNRFDLTLETQSYHNLGIFVQKIENCPDVFAIEVASIIAVDGIVKVSLTVNTVLVSKK